MSKTKRLSHVEEIELTRKQFQKLESGTRAYRRCLDTIVTHNLGLVNKIVNKFPLKNATCTFDDLFQEGVAGLIHGVRKFEPAKGYRLSTYVTTGSCVCASLLPEPRSHCSCARPYV